MEFYKRFLIIVINREPADELLYRLRVTEPRATFMKTVDLLGMGPIEFATRVRKHMRVRNTDLLLCLGMTKSSRSFYFFSLSLFLSSMFFS